MVFSSIVFIWYFLPIVLVGNIFIHKYGKEKFSNIFLLLASLLFYAWGEPVYIFLMLFSVLANWSLGIAIADKERYRKLLLIVAIIVNMAIIGFFKYVKLFVMTINILLRTSFTVPDIALPIGISFFTFQALSYVVDVYRGESNAQRSITKLALYISFFPQLIAGPIVKYKDIERQIESRSITLEKTTGGIRRFIYGFSKKILISNTLASCVDNIYALETIEITGILAWGASILYTLQIYYDFSGYSDMAIGLGKIFGFDFKENFNYPYTSLSIREFWRRWHISLSSWFREYVYFPLGGNRNGHWQTYRNLVVVFFLTGLWHGANYNYILWGLYHGLFIVIERIGFERCLEKNKVIAWFYTFVVVNVGWVFFRIESIRAAFHLVIKMLSPWKFADGIYSIWNFVDHKALTVLACAILGMGILQRNNYLCQKISKYKYSICEAIFCMMLMVLSIISLASDAYNPFIYFRF